MQVDGLNSKSVYAAIAVHVAASLPLWLMPLTVGGVTEQLGFSLQSAGMIASADASGVLLGTVIALFWISRVPFRSTATVLLALLAAAHWISSHQADWLSLYASRLLAGVFAGSLMSISGTIIGRSPEPDRNLALLTGIQMLCAAIAFRFLSAWVAEGSMSVFYLALAGLAVVVSPALYCLPVRNDFDSESHGQTAGESAGTHGGLLLIAVTIPAFLFQAGVASTWAFVDRMGAIALLSQPAIGEILAWSMIASTIGSLSAWLLGTRLGRLRPLMFVLVLQLAALWIYAGPASDKAWYFAASMMFAYAFNAAVGYLFGLAVTARAHSHTPVAFLLMVQLGMATGPALASALVTAGDLSPALYLSAFMFGGAFAWCVLLVRKHPG